MYNNNNIVYYYYRRYYYYYHIITRTAEAFVLSPRVRTACRQRRRGEHTI